MYIFIYQLYFHKAEGKKRNAMIKGFFAMKSFNSKSCFFLKNIKQLMSAKLSYETFDDNKLINTMYSPLI